MHASRIVTYGATVLIARPAPVAPPESHVRRCGGVHRDSDVVW